MIDDDYSMDDDYLDDDFDQSEAPVEKVTAPEIKPLTKDATLSDVDNDELDFGGLESDNYGDDDAFEKSEADFKSEPKTIVPVKPTVIPEPVVALKEEKSFVPSVSKPASSTFKPLNSVPTSR